MVLASGDQIIFLTGGKMINNSGILTACHIIMGTQEFLRGGIQFQIRIACTVIGGLKCIKAGCRRGKTVVPFRRSARYIDMVFGDCG